jgi:hypothetical protein
LEAINPGTKTITAFGDIALLGTSWVSALTVDKRLEM